MNIKRIKKVIIIKEAVALLLIAIPLYFLLPVFLSYGPYILLEDMHSWIDSYLMQYASAWIAYISINLAFLAVRLKDIENLIATDNTIKLQLRCTKLPFQLYFLQLFVPVVLTAIVFIALLIYYEISIIFFIKTILLVLALSAILSVFSYIFTSKEFTEILAMINLKKVEIGQSSIKNKMLYLLVPIILSSMIFTFLGVYSKYIDEKSELYYILLKDKLDNSFEQTNNKNKIEEKLKNIKIDNLESTYFIIRSDKSIVSNGNMSKMFIFYEKYYGEFSSRIYELIGDIQGVIKKINVDGEIWTVGFKYNVYSDSAMIMFFLVFLFVFLINSFIIYYFSSDISDNIKRITSGLHNISSDNFINTSIPVTSNDELGNLIIAYNSVHDAFIKYSDILIQNEKLKTLGQLSGGIAHNLMTPLMSCSGGVQALKEGTKEIDELLANLKVYSEDNQYKNIVNDMYMWEERIKHYIIYMADIISAIRGQTTIEKKHCTFTVEELIKNISMLLDYELKKNKCKLIQSNYTKDMQLFGNINSLVQVINNVISNSIDAYENEGGTIEFTIKDASDNIVFEITDYGKGIKEEFQKKLLTEIFTSKGTKGTGIGLYVSNSIIIGEFKGSIEIKSNKGKGTTVYINIPKGGK